jgi:phosphatidylinositol glycan class N
VLYCYVAFFGTGNIASISSFDVSSTYRFTTVFAPFLMGAIMVFKLLIPFSLCCHALVVINRCVGIQETASFLLVSGISDVLTINFFFLVTDSGSWKEIGQSISHFAVSNLYIVTQLFLFTLARIYLHGSVYNVGHIKDE